VDRRRRFLNDANLVKIFAGAPFENRLVAENGNFPEAMNTADHP
jgi:hypothetical protein